MRKRSCDGVHEAAASKDLPPWVRIWPPAWLWLGEGPASSLSLRLPSCRGVLCGRAD